MWLSSNSCHEMIYICICDIYMSWLLNHVIMPLWVCAIVIYEKFMFQAMVKQSVSKFVRKSLVFNSLHNLIFKNKLNVYMDTPICVCPTWNMLWMIVETICIWNFGISLPWKHVWMYTHCVKKLNLLSWLKFMLLWNCVW